MISWLPFTTVNLASSRRLQSCAVGSCICKNSRCDSPQASTTEPKSHKEQRRSYRLSFCSCAEDDSCWSSHLSPQFSPV
ncbi:hypothetical protein WJX84_003276 [Apatococcus fuscideae]|uniref:Secreted protein n=1 Tax=Apatococcus fuscideae TaxID=2026836 RepID=A0AAW1TBS6_9CHLO